MRQPFLIASILFAVGLSIVATPSLAQERRSPDSFQQLYLDALKSDHPDAVVVSATVDEIVIRRPDGSEFTTFLGNAYRRHLEGQSADEAVAVLIGLIDRTTTPLTVEHAYALIRPHDFVIPPNVAAAAQDGEWKLPLHRPLAGDLMVFVAQDDIDSFSFPSEEEVTGLFGSEAAAWTEVLAHTMRQLGDVSLEDLGSGLSLITAREDIAASLLLDDGLWSSPEILKLAKRPAVGVVKSGLLMVDSENAVARDLLRRVMAQTEDSSDFLSTDIFIREEGKWSVLEP